MKSSEVKVGGVYVAKVGSNITEVRLDTIREVTGFQGRSSTAYDVTNLRTGRKTTFRSAAKFRLEVKPKVAAHAKQGNKVMAGGDEPDRLANLAPQPERVCTQLIHSVDPTGEHCLACDADACSCQVCGKRVCGTTVDWVEGKGNVCKSHAADLTQTPPPVASAALRPVGQPAPTKPQPRVVAPPPSPSAGVSGGLAAKLGGSMDLSSHLIVQARAGTGKTTTLVHGLRHLTGDWRCKCGASLGCRACGGTGIVKQLTPSPQQAAVWDAICETRGKTSNIAFCAFNRSIAEELKTKVPNGCEAMTMHSLGAKAVNRAYGYCKPEGWRVSNLIADIMMRDPREIRRNDPVLLSAVEDLVGLCKMNLIGYGPGRTPEVDFNWHAELDVLSSHYSVDVNGSRAKIYDMVPRVLAKCLDVRGIIDFDDMIWLPVVRQLPVARYGLLMVDEAQDLNRCQQALAMMAGDRLILCGDDRQAIYAFAGADSRSLDRMKEQLAATDRSCRVLPLTETRRCGRAIVAEANRWVPDLTAHETNPEGLIRRRRFGSKIKAGQCICQGADVNCMNCGGTNNLVWRAEVKDGDMVVCRTNAPLISECFKFIREGRKAVIQGRDIGKGLTDLIDRLVKKMPAEVSPESRSSAPNRSGAMACLTEALDNWLHSETSKELAKVNPSESRIEGLQDRYDCISCMMDDCDSIEALLSRIGAIFVDSKDVKGVRLGSIHRSKGLEAHRVYFLKPKGGPRRDKMKPHDVQQEENLDYVGVTRAIDELIYVHEAE